MLGLYMVTSRTHFGGRRNELSAFQSVRAAPAPADSATAELEHVAPSPAWMPPHLIADRYDVIAEVGRGGFAVVYRARDRVFERDVAIKVLHAANLEDAALERFTRELRILARLEHPHILHVYDAGELDGRPFFVTEFVHGLSLERKMLKSGALPIDESLSILREVSSALAFAHEQEVVHRDVKPANVLLGSGGAVLGDFGIARAIGADDLERLTSAGVAVGTVQYMSPEQLCAEPSVDARSDQYSLALVAYEMFTGVPAHVAGSVEGLRGLRLRGGNVSVKVLRPTVPDVVDFAIAKALSPTPVDRFKSMREFLAVVEAVGTGERTVHHLGALAGASLDRMTTPGGSGHATITHGASAAVSGPLSPRIPRRLRWFGATAALAALLLVTWSVMKAPAGVAGETGTDSTLILVMAPATPLDSSYATLLQTELEAWSDVVVAQEVVSSGDRSWTASALESVARAQSALSVVALNARPDGDSIRLGVQSWRHGNGAIPGQRYAFDAETMPASRALRVIVSRALAGSAADSVPGLARLNVPSRAVVEQFVSGWRALHAGQLVDAAAAFAEVSDRDPAWPDAALWAAQAAAWNEPRDSSWRPYAERAVGANTLPASDSLHAAALLAMSHFDYPAAARAFAMLAAREPDHFAAAFGLAESQRLDRRVIGTPPRFQSSHASAVRAYGEALDRLKVPGWSFLMDRATSTFYVAEHQSRGGYTAAVVVGQRDYAAFPQLIGDTIGFVPVPFEQFASTDGKTIPVSHASALALGRQQLRDFASAWIRKGETDFFAWKANALALELSQAVGEARNATVQYASLATTTEQQIEAGIDHIRLTLKLEQRDSAFVAARELLLAHPDPSPARAALLLPVAALLGDTTATMRLLNVAVSTEVGRQSLPSWATERMPTPALMALRRYATHALLGDCRRVRDAHAELEAELAIHVARDNLPALNDVRLDLARAAVVCVGESVMEGLTPRIPLDRVLFFLHEGRFGEARAELERIEIGRQRLRRSGVSIDHALAEEWAWRRLGEEKQAAQIRKAQLGSMTSVSPYVLDELGQAAALGRWLRREADPLLR